MSRPAATSLVTAYNYGRYITATLESVLAQTIPASDHEVIVVDNGSTDDTARALEPYLDRIRYVRQENRGRAGARNRLIEEARGEYVAFLDSDDVWLPGKLERQVRVFDEHPDVGLVHGPVEVIDEAGRPLPEVTAQHDRIYERVHRNGATYEGYALQCMCLTSTVMARRSCLEAVGRYDTRIGLEDLDLYLRIALDTRILYLGPPPLARYRWHGAQTGNEAITVGQIAVCRKHLALLETRDVPNARRARRNLYLTLARSHHILLEPRGVRSATLQAIAAEPSALLVPGVLRRLVLSLVPTALLRRVRERRATSPRLLGEPAWRR